MVAGPPGAGKSSIFPVSSFGVSYFNADDRVAELNGGSYLGIGCGRFPARPRPVADSTGRLATRKPPLRRDDIHPIALQARLK